MRVCVFGSSSKNTIQTYLDASYELGVLLATRGHTCVNGAGKFGCMGSLSEGCLSNDGYVVGVIHEMWCVDGGDENTKLQKIIVSRGTDLTERKQLLYDNGDCIIALPGGVGTFDELWEAICAKSLSMKGLSNKPICLVNTNGFYDGFIMQMQRASEDKLLYNKVEEYFHVSNTPQDALEWCERAFSNCNSVEYEEKLEDMSSSRKSAKLPSWK